MASFDAYESNIQARLAELRQGDRAYEIHGDAILETLPYVASDDETEEQQRILDVGCGLGFLAAKIAITTGDPVVGIDPSEKAIALARSEHSAIPNLSFYAAEAQTFADMMLELNERPFNRAILNMVLHSMDDENRGAVLSGIRDALASDGTLTLIVPGQSWLRNKLIERARAEHMPKEEGIEWVSHQMREPEVTIRVGIEGQEAYAQPLTLYNRSLSHYGKLLLAHGYGVDMNVYDPATLERKQVIPLPFWEWSDHLNGYELTTRDRHVVMTQVRAA